MIQIIVSSVLVFLYLPPGSVTIASGQMIDIKVLQVGTIGQCPFMEEREKARNEIHQVVIHSATHQFTCNGTQGWRRVAFINMTDTSYNCPTGLNLTSYSKRTCGQTLTNARCSSTIFSVGSVPYSRVCGRIRGYQFGDTGAFFSHDQDIDNYYTDGIILTHGDAGSCQHIWTFAAGLAEVTTHWPHLDCPCDSKQNDSIPNFVENDYFCESGINRDWIYQIRFHPNDVLWDGQDCVAASLCCQFNNPPWFTKNLSSATNDDIELRTCTTPFELVELYIQ